MKLYFTSAEYILNAIKEFRYFLKQEKTHNYHLLIQNFIFGTTCSTAPLGPPLLFVPQSYRSNRSSNQWTQTLGRWELAKGMAGGGGGGSSGGKRRHM